MATDRPVIVDTNILFSALVSGQRGMGDVLLHSDRRLYVCEYVIVELFKHKDRLVEVSHLSEEDIWRWLYLLLKRLDLFKEDLISPANRTEAYRLCANIDENDTPHVALTLELNGLLWTGDKKLKHGLQLKGFDQFFEPTKN